MTTNEAALVEAIKELTTSPIEYDGKYILRCSRDMMYEIEQLLGSYGYGRDGLTGTEWVRE